MTTLVITGSLAGTSLMPSFHAALATQLVGLSQTFDSGQLNLNTAPTTVATANYLYGYTVYRWFDALSSSYPLYLRVEWRNGAATSGAPTAWFMRVSVGTGTDGAGNLTGKVISSAGAWNNFTTGYQSVNHYLSLYNGALNIAAGTTQNSFNLGWHISADRLRGLNGQLATGAFLWQSSQTGSGTVPAGVFSGNRAAVLNAATVNGPVPAVSALGAGFDSLLTYPATWFNETGSYIDSNNVPALPLYISDPAPRTIQGMVLVPRVDTPTLTQFTMNRFGETQNYIVPSTLGITTAQYHYAFPWM